MVRVRPRRTAIRWTPSPRPVRLRPGGPGVHRSVVPARVLRPALDATPGARYLLLDSHSRPAGVPSCRRATALGAARPGPRPPAGRAVPGAAGPTAGRPVARGLAGTSAPAPPCRPGSGAAGPAVPARVGGRPTARPRSTTMPDGVAHVRLHRPGEVGHLVAQQQHRLERRALQAVRHRRSKKEPRDVGRSVPGGTWAPASLRPNRFQSVDVGTAGRAGSGCRRRRR